MLPGSCRYRQVVGGKQPRKTGLKVRTALQSGGVAYNQHNRRCLVLSP